jgi:hypothetical protein
MLALQYLAISTAITRILGKACTNGRANTRSWSGSNCWIGTEHADSGAKLGSTKRDHMLPDVAGDDLPMLRVGVSQNVLDEIVAVLVTGNINEWNSRTIKTTFADSIQVAT